MPMALNDEICKAYTMMTDTATYRYAQLMLDALGLQSGQPLVVRADPRLWDFFLQLAEAAYDRGATYVSLWPVSEELIRVQATHSRDAHLSYIPASLQALSQVAMEENSAFLRITTSWDPSALQDVDQARLSTLYMSYKKARQVLLRACMADKHPWLVAAYPTEGWARQVLGPESTAADIWAILREIVLGPTDDSWAWWQEKSSHLESHAKHLTNLQLSKLHITGPGTDLHIGLSHQAVWDGGRSRTPDGQVFLPNLPTEEVFTAPDHRRTEGVVSATFPLVIDGKVVEGARFTFEQGKLVDYQADTGKEVLDAFFSLDEGITGVGEIALANCDSPIGKAKKLFYDGLLDENAAVHMAFGAAYPTNLRPGCDYESHGLNSSLGHEDIMIGDEHTEVTAEAYDGTTHLLMKEGRILAAD